MNAGSARNVTNRTVVGPRGVILGSLGLACCLLVAGASVAETGLPGDRWQHADPMSLGVDPAPLQALDEEIRAGAHGNIDSMTIIRGGKIIF